MLLAQSPSLPMLPFTQVVPTCDFHSYQELPIVTKWQPLLPNWAYKTASFQNSEHVNILMLIGGSHGIKSTKYLEVG